MMNADMIYVFFSDGNALNQWVSILNKFSITAAFLCLSDIGSVETDSLINRTVDLEGNTEKEI